MCRNREAGKAEDIAGENLFLHLSLFERMISISQACGVNSKAYGDNSKGYGFNSASLGDRNHSFKKA